MMITSSKSQAKSESVESILEISKSNEEPPCIKDHRIAMWEAYLKESIPNRVSHLWRYSDPTWFELSDKEITTKSSELIFDLDSSCKDKGVILTKLKDAFKLTEFREKIKNTFGALIKESPNRLTYLNEAAWSSGYFLYVPKGVSVEKPISVKLCSKQSAKLETIRILVILEENSFINLIEEINSEESSDLLTNVVLEMYLAKDSRLNYLNFQSHGKETVHHLFQRAVLDERAELTNLIIALGGKTSKADLGTNLKGERSSVSIFGIVVGDETQRFDHHTTIVHNAPHTCSNLDFRVALKDKARSAFTGNLKIANNAIKSDAHQENRNLLLSSKAKAESIPELEILTSDVERCNHGVTVGQVDKDQIFYLMSRGMNYKEAERLIIEGFLAPTISRVPEEHLKEEIVVRVNKKLESL